MILYFNDEQFIVNIPLHDIGVITAYYITS